MSTQQVVRHWVPAAFCALIVYLYVGNGAASLDNWKYVAIWLTMCFFFVGMVTYSMQKQIRDLQAEIQRLQTARRESACDE